MLSSIFICLVIVIQIQDNAATSTKPYHAIVDNYFQNRHNRKELEAIIKYLNDNTDAEIEQNENLEINEDTGNYKVEEIMELAQKNYDTKVAMELEKPEESPRLHMIKNPEVLKEYVKALRSRATSSSSSDYDSSDYSDSEWDRMQRRNADYDQEKSDKDINDSRESTKRKKYAMKGNINFKILRNKKNTKRDQDSNNNSGKYDKEPIKTTEQERKVTKRFEEVEDTWKIITKDKWKENNKYTTDYTEKKTQKSRKPESKPKKSYKDYDAVKHKERKIKNSWENEDKWKTTRRDKKKKDYDYSENKPKKNTYGYTTYRTKTTKRYDDDWGRNKYTKRTNNNWDRLTTTRNSWVNPVRKKPARESRIRDTYVKPIGRFGGMGMWGSFRGRTPIPFVGKKGIYEEN